MRNQGIFNWKKHYEQAVTLCNQAIAALAAREAGQCLSVVRVAARCVRKIQCPTICFSLEKITDASHTTLIWVTL